MTDGGASADAGRAGAAFNVQMMRGVEEMKRAGYTPQRFLNMAGDTSPLEAARRLLDDPKGSDGFTNLWSLKRLDLSGEALALLPWYESLFSAPQRRAARRLLEDHGFDVGQYLAHESSKAPDWFGAP